jgi:hypothetical protein
LPSWRFPVAAGEAAYAMSKGPKTTRYRALPTLIAAAETMR